jgi:hypothetical protein
LASIRVAAETGSEQRKAAAVMEFELELEIAELSSRL